ncbi:multiple epidermal growth factor-like domains protein 11, partial [Ylistrum balloti]|uniref:multiple epidermal growth factor-like domains protein 11 n=1 Tax=Ylistrum balloti TaxID=509963 RepID=UPI00290584E7
NSCRNPNVKTTSQSSNHAMTFTSEKAVDGCINQNFGNKCCIHTQANPSLLEAWWQINLGGPVVIELVKIYRNDVVKERSSRFGGFQIYLSNTTDWRNGDNCHRDTTSTWQSMDLAPSIQSCTGNTIYLTIYVDRRANKPYSWYSGYAILELCEVEIYACVDGYHGNKCDQPCPDHCKDNVCKQGNGTCRGCKSGFHGTMCNQRCPANCKDDRCNQFLENCEACTIGNYGIECKKRCGQCRGDGTCNINDGACECSDGWEGDTCNKKQAQVSATEDQTAVYAGVSVGVVTGLAVLVIVLIVLLRRFALLLLM